MPSESCGLCSETAGWQVRSFDASIPLALTSSTSFVRSEALWSRQTGGSTSKVASETWTGLATLREMGYDVLRFWNNDILTNREGVLEEIAARFRPSANRNALLPADKVS